jgi:hypothetical protein
MGNERARRKGEMASVAGPSMPSLSRIVASGAHEVVLLRVNGRDVLLSLRCWQL